MQKLVGGRLIINSSFNDLFIGHTLYILNEFEANSFILLWNKLKNLFSFFIRHYVNFAQLIRPFGTLLMANVIKVKINFASPPTCLSSKDDNHVVLLPSPSKNARPSSPRCRWQRRLTDHDPQGREIQRWITLGCVRLSPASRKMEHRHGGNRFDAICCSLFRRV